MRNALQPMTRLTPSRQFKMALDSIKLRGMSARGDRSLGASPDEGRRRGEQGERR